MRVPTASVDRDKGHAGFDQTPRQQHALAKAVAAIPFARPGIFLTDVEGALGGGAGDHLERLPSKGIEAIHQAGLVGIAAKGVDGLQEPPAIVKPIHADAVGQREIANREVIRVRVIANGKRIVRHAEIARRGTARGIGHRDVSRDTWLACAALAGDDRAIAGHFLSGDVVGRPVTREEVVAGRFMAGVGMGHRADDTKPIHQPSRARQMFANVDTGDIGLDGPEVAAILGRSIGLEIPGIDVAGAAAFPDQDD